MLYLRVNEVADGAWQYNIWFDLDAKHETYIAVEPTMQITAVLAVVDVIRDRYKKGLPIEYHKKGLSK